MSSGCKCGSSCGCGSDCSCGEYGNLGATETIIAGVAPVKMVYEKMEMSFGAENGCKCGSSCSCDPCNCK